MPTVAEQLRGAREAQQIPIERVAEITKMRADHIRALEEGNFDVFCAPVYIRGFVRTLSTELKLNVPGVLRDLEAELNQTAKFAEPPSLSDQPRGVLDFVMLQLSRVDWRKVAIAGGVIFLLLAIFLGYVLWRHHRTTDPLRNLPPGVSGSSVSAQNRRSAMARPMPGRKPWSSA